ncbi:MAG: hypothetical protein FWE38_02455 [Firmicutes bacterium]|nr:hypothetical protein [Bacillota bacterium]
MKSVWTLIKLQFKARVALQKKRTGRETAKFILLLVLAAVIFGAFIFAYYMLANQFVMERGSPFDLRREFLIFTILGFQAIQTIFLVPTLVRKLDINNERELLLKLPVTERQIFMSKIFVSYLFEILFATIILLPILIAYAFAANMAWGFAVYIPFILILAPVLPFFIATLLLYPMQKLVAFMRVRAITTSLVYLVGLVLAIIVYMEIVNQIMYAVVDSGQFTEALRENAESIQNGARWFLPQWLFANMIDTRWYTALWSFFAVIGLSAILMVISYIVAGANYKKTFADERAQKTSFACKSTFTKRHPFYASAKKETLNIARSSNYTFQFLIVVVLTPLFVYLVSRVAMFSSYQNFRNWGGAVEEANALTFGVSMFVLLILLPLSSSFAASSITREGWNVYHTKLIPVEFRRQLLIKSLVVFVPIFISIVASVLILRIPYNPDPTGGFALLQYIYGWDAWYLLISGTMLAVGYICMGMYLDLRAPLCNQVAAGELTGSTKHINTIMIIGLVVGGLVGMFTMAGEYSSHLALGPDWLRVVSQIGNMIRPIFFFGAIGFGLISATLLFAHGPRRYYALEQ